MIEIIPIPDNAVTLDTAEMAQQNVAAALVNAPFFNRVRAKLFNGEMVQSQVDGINALVLASVRQNLTVEQTAYVLATAYHETAHTMKPVSEYGRGGNRDYGRWRINSNGERYCFKNGNRDTAYTEAECPHLFYGRGYVQLTWYDNYLRAGKKLGLDLLCNPDAANQPEHAAQIIVAGMSEGWFTGKKLSDYINGHRCDFANARRIVNGTDKAEIIASYARDFFNALNLV